MSNIKPEFIHNEAVYNQKASEIVVPILIEMFNPQSVLDVGCGLGTWLNSFKNRGTPVVLGVDGEYSDKTKIYKYLSMDEFMVHDLTKPLNIGKKFDLVISLEVAEHLPPEASDHFIRSLVSHGDTIVFSAAIPHQGGQNHLNEQWKHYWINIFKEYDFRLFDILRWRLWNIPDVDWWYKQNMLVFSSNEILMNQKPSSDIPEAVHPELFLQNIDYIIYLRQYIVELEAKHLGFKLQ